MTTPSWTSGYVGDVAYTLGFYREMAPPFLDYVCVINGFAGVAKRDGLRYCELGCGRGYGTALIAAANPDGVFVGIDFNPAHVGEARDFAARAGVGNVVFVESNFAEAARSTDPALAAFDVVAIHGVYSWVGPAVRESIHDFLRAKLAPGGVAYVSYNTYPGWSSAAPVQRLIKEYADRAAGDSLKRVAAGREALKALVEKSPFFAAQNPGAKRRLELMASQNPAYVAHEYLNENWSPLYVTEAMAALAEAKLAYVGSANIGENRLPLCVPPDLVPLVQSAPDRALHELLKDYAINKQFRRDVYVKGPTRLTGRDADVRYDAMAFALTARPATLPEAWRVPTGTAKPKPGVVEAILSRLEDGPATGAALRALGRQGDGFAAGDITAFLDILIHNNAVNPCRPDFASVERTSGQRLNKAILDLSHGSDTHRFLSAPVLGAAIAAPYFERLAGAALAENGEASDGDVARRIFDRFDGASNRLMREGKPLERNDQTLSEMAGMVKAFRAAALPRWRALGVLP